MWRSPHLEYWVQFHTPQSKWKGYCWAEDNTKMLRRYAASVLWAATEKKKNRCLLWEKRRSRGHTISTSVTERAPRAGRNRRKWLNACRHRWVRHCSDAFSPLILTLSFKVPGPQYTQACIISLQACKEQRKTSLLYSQPHLLRLRISALLLTDSLCLKSSEHLRSVKAKQRKRVFCL